MNPMDLIPEAEARKRLHLKAHTLRRLRRLGRGPRYTRLGAGVFYQSEDLESWVEANTTKPESLTATKAQEGGTHE